MTYQEIVFETVTVNRQGQIIDREQRQAQQFVEALASGVVLESDGDPRGAFLMGSAQGHGYDDQRPQHRVEVAPFLMGKHPVTQAQWAAVMGQRTRPGSAATCGQWRTSRGTRRRRFAAG